MIIKTNSGSLTVTFICLSSVMSIVILMTFTMMMSMAILMAFTMVMSMVILTALSMVTMLSMITMVPKNFCKSKELFMGDDQCYMVLLCA